MRQVALLAVAVVLVGCGSRRPPARVFAEYEGTIRSRDVAQGRQTFSTLCAACHRGRVNPQGLHWTPAHMRHQIREGNALMPALRPGRLSDDRVEAVLAYLSTIGAIDGTLPPHPDEWPEGDAWVEQAGPAHATLLGPPPEDGASTAAPAATVVPSSSEPAPTRSLARALARP